MSGRPTPRKTDFMQVRDSTRVSLLSLGTSVVVGDRTSISRKEEGGGEVKGVRVQVNVGGVPAVR